MTDPGTLADLLGVPFSDEQLAAITAPLESGLVEAAAGSGKTTVMAARVVWLVLTGQITPGQVVGLTFTRKAAAQLRRKVADALASAGWPLDEAAAGEPLVATYDAFAAGLVAEHGAWGSERPGRLLDDAGRFQLAAAVVDQAAGPLERLGAYVPRSVAGYVLDLDQAMGSNLVGGEALRAATAAFLGQLAAAPRNGQGDVFRDVERAAEAAAARLELAGLRDAYTARKRAEGVTEFADQMAAAVELARSQPRLRRDFAQQGVVVLLDEYQDTSAAQAILLKELFGPKPGDPGRPVMAVGDPFQAIYGWRGASASNLLDFPADFTASGRPARRHSLAVNRRSGEAVVEVANAVARPLREHAGRPAAGDDRVVRAADGAGPGWVETAGFLTWDEEAAWVAGRIAAALDRGEAGRWRDVAVLARRNAELGPLWQALTDLDVPVEIVGVGGLVQVPEVAYLVACLRLAADPEDNPSLVQVLSGPRYGVGRAGLAWLGRRAAQLARQTARSGEGAPLGAALADPGPAWAEDGAAPLRAALADPGPGCPADLRRRCAALEADVASWGRLRDVPVTEAVARLVQMTGLAVELAGRPEPSGSIRRRQVAAFRAAAARHAAGRRGATLAGFLAWLDAEAEVGIGLDRAEASAEDSVKLLTVHRAKGLEWEVVFLPALVDGVFPSTRTTANPLTRPAALPHSLRADRRALPRLAEVTGPGLKEFTSALREDQLLSEHRLAYVAVTRARTRLVATTHLWRAGTRRPRAASPYFVLLEDVARRCGQVGPRPVVAGPQNPLDSAQTALDWPDPAARRRAAAVDELARRVERRRGAGPRDRAEVAEALARAPEEVRREVAAWDRSAARLLGEARAGGEVVAVAVPAGLTVSQVLWAARAPAEFAAALARPWPRPPSAAGRVGGDFHRWFEEHVKSPSLLDEVDWADGADQLAADEDDEAAAGERLREAFLSGRFAGLDPVAVEHSFSLAVGGTAVRGRIDAVYDRAGAPGVVPDGARYLVVDWKTGRRRPDPLQLATYRLAWAKHAGVPPGDVAAGFHFVAQDRLEIVEKPLDEAGVAAVLARLGQT